MKKYISIMLCALVLSTALFGCGGRNNDMKDDVSSVKSKVESTVSDTISDVESGVSSIRSDMMDSSK